MSRYLIKDGGNFTFTSSICVKMLVKIAEGELLHFFFLQPTSYIQVESWDCYSDPLFGCENYRNASSASVGKCLH
jgi:hypothetical protein